MIKKSVVFFSILPLICSCYNHVEEDKKAEEKFYSLKIQTNIKEATNYSVNVDDTEKIKEGTDVTISNTFGKYRINQILDEDNNLVASSNSYSFKMDSDKSFKLIFQYNLDYFKESYFNSFMNDEETNIIVMAGQSNMEGHDGVWNTSLTKKEIYDYRSGHDNVFITYNNYGRTGNFAYGVENSGYFKEVDFGQALTSSNMGPEVGLAKYLGQNSSNKKYSLVKIAKGDTNLMTHWNPDNIDNANTDGRYMYKRLVDGVNKVIERFNKYRIKPRIRALCWYQGEADSATSEEMANSYGENFQKFQSDFKNRFANYIGNDFKVISAGLYVGTDTKWTWGNIVNQALKDNSDRYISDSESLELVSQYHFTCHSYLKIGEAFGREFLN